MRVMMHISPNRLSVTNAETPAEYAISALAGSQAMRRKLYFY